MSFPDSEILKEFEKAPQGSRHEFLTKLSSKFHPSDWHHLHSLLSARSYYVDFLTALPIELSLQILLYIPPEQTILLRAVSRRYSDLLTSPETCRFLVHNLFPLSAPSTESWKIHYENLLSRRLFFERGQPTSFEKMPEGQSLTSFCAETSTLASLVDNTRVQVHLLTTSPPTLLLPPKPMSDRTFITEIALTSSIVATISNNTCQVWNLSTHATHSFRLTSAWVSAIHGSGNILAISIRDELLIHDAAQKKTKIFEIPDPNPRTNTHSLIVHEPTRRVWVVANNLRRSDGLVQIVVTALCLDTAAVVVPAQEFDWPFQQTRLSDAGSGVWSVGGWGLRKDGTLRVVQIRINIGGGATKAVRFSEYSPVFSHALQTEGGDEGTMSTWGDISWAHATKRGSVLIFDSFTLRVREILIDEFGHGATAYWQRRRWWFLYVCERFVVVGNSLRSPHIGLNDLGILRFKGMQERKMCERSEMPVGVGSLGVSAEEGSRILPGYRSPTLSP